MEEVFNNSLLGQLNKSGFYQNAADSAVEDAVASCPDILNKPNPLLISVNENDIENSPFVDNPIEKTAEKSFDDTNFNGKPASKRLNDLDLNILQDNALKKAEDEFSGNNVIGKILCRYFPKIYKGFLIKKALNKLKALNQTAAELVSKRIPYGESDKRYDALSDSISNANTIHAKLLKKI